MVLLWDLHVIQRASDSIPRLLRLCVFVTAVEMRPRRPPANIDHPHGRIWFVSGLLPPPAVLPPPPPSCWTTGNERPRYETDRRRVRQWNKDRLPQWGIGINGCRLSTMWREGSWISGRRWQPSIRNICVSTELSWWISEELNYIANQ